MFRWLMLLIAIISFAYSLLRVADYWEYEELAPNIAQRFKQAMSIETMQAQIETQIKAQQLHAAQQSMQLAQYFSYPLDYPTYQKQIDELDTIYYRSTTNISHFLSGFATGKGDSNIAVAGAMTSDFTVIGDVRDLHEQYQHYQAGQSVNQLIVILSGVGISLTAATIGSVGVTAPIKAGTSLLKFASKTGRLSASFTQELLRKGQRAFDWQKFIRLSKAENNVFGIKRAAMQTFNPQAMKSLSQLGDQANNIRKATSSTADTVHLLKYVDNSQDLASVEKLALKHGIHSRGIMTVLGKTALRGVKVLKKSLELLLSLLTLIVSGLLNLYLLFPSRKKKSKKSHKRVVSH